MTTLANIPTQEDKVLFIQDMITEHFRLGNGDMTRWSRPEHIAWPRQMAMALSRECTTLTLARIGHFFGDRGHATVLYAIKMVKERRSIEPSTEALMNQFKVMVEEKFKK